MKKKLRYEGQELVVTYDVQRCTHAGECVRGLPSVFDTDRKPWIDPDGAQAEEVLTIIDRCPSGALACEGHDHASAEASTVVNTVTVSPDGPVYLRGDIEVLAADGSVLLRDSRVALCRCGHSADKPLCDRSHSQAEFKDAGEVGEARLRPDGEGRTLRVTQAANGPLILEGPFEVVGEGGAVAKGFRGALCRCGASANKPFCDGTHSTIGFEAG